MYHVSSIKINKQMSADGWTLAHNLIRSVLEEHAVSK
jgi:hypothetical protein